jgi:hypothetical protein
MSEPTTLQIAETALVLLLIRTGKVHPTTTCVTVRDCEVVERDILLSEMRDPGNITLTVLSSKFSNLLALLQRHSGDQTDIRLHPEVEALVQNK